jgi:flagellar protein FlaG
MQNKVAPVAIPPESTYGRQTASGTQTATTSTGNVAQKGDEELRLVIEEDLAAQSYIYKTINLRTGEVVHQYPREEVLRMREDANYHAGGVIRTKA